MQHHHPLANDGAKENPGNAFGTLEAKLKQTVTECLGVRLPQMGPQRLDPPRENDVPRRKRVRQPQNFLLHFLAVVGDGVVHESS